MDYLQPEPHAHAHNTLDLVDSLNELIDKLSISLPFVLETPWDLTPGLLLGILESILQSRLPVPPTIRASRDFMNQVQAMKIFLGVFESDVLGGEDVGLSEVDPRRLAAGEEEEVEFIGELLCWLGRRKGFLPGPSRPGDDHPPSLRPITRRRATSPSTHSTITSGMHSNLSMMQTGVADSDTSMSSFASEQLTSLTQTLPELPSLPLAPSSALRSSTSSTGSGRPPPRCIHEVEDPSFALDREIDASNATSMCHCATMEGHEEEDDLPPPVKTPLPFRYDGWIDKANETSELEFYYDRRSPPGAPLSTSTSRRAKSYSGLSASPSQPHPSSHGQSPILSDGGPHRIITPHNAPTTEYTLALLNERARLLDELAKIKATTSVAM
ncbi:hypothetical protein GSI_15492 [Ganoderma sinense ZZ0214-1]|uniref:DUF5745 domain-containing protein n=1 Tax=Ganoderma sinense ZZ0214-1 TaxID=1077348 RepID=A0A2G8RMQ2_9APHY|nr:hypothetical protein GSI_15492 [Ganoderma sinense ZZ0214-1]